MTKKVRYLTRDDGDFLTQYLWHKILQIIMVDKDYLGW